MSKDIARQKKASKVAKAQEKSVKKEEAQSELAVDPS